MNHALNQDATAMSRLTVAERLFIWGFRSLAQPRKPGSPTRADLELVYEHFCVADSLQSLEALLHTFACAAHSSIELHLAGCCCLSPGEHDLLQAIAAVQCERFGSAMKQFERWLPPVAADWAIAPARGLATIFETAGLKLPDREGSKVMAMQNVQVGSLTLH